MITYAMIRELLHLIVEDLRQAERFKWRWYA